MLKVKGDFCHSVRRILDDAGRADDYLEIGLGGAWQWNPLDDPLLDTYSLAYSVASLINQLFGKSREPSGSFYTHHKPLLEHPGAARLLVCRGVTLFKTLSRPVRGLVHCKL